MSTSPDSTPRNAAPASLLAGLGEDLRKRTFTWLLVRGILALILGILLFVAPGFGAAAIGIFVAFSIGLWLIMDGTILCSMALRDKKVGAAKWGWVLAGGILTLLSGLVVLIFPLAIAAFLGLFILWTMAIALVLRGVADLGDRHLGGWGIALGVINILFGVVFAILLFANPTSALVSLVWVAGVYGVVFGVTGIVTAFRVRNAA